MNIILKNWRQAPVNKQNGWEISIVILDNEEFANLPANIRYDILTDLKETRKRNSWGRIHELPKVSIFNQSYYTYIYL